MRWPASLRQVYGSVQPAFLYLVDSCHLDFLSLLLCSGFSNRDSWVTKLPTVSTLWCILRHLVWVLYSQRFEPSDLPMWCQAGSCILCSRDRVGASRVRLYLAPILRVSRISLGIVL